MPAHALPEYHHAGAIARFLEVHMECRDATRKRIDHQRHPWPAEFVRPGRVGQFDVQLGMVKVTDLKRAVAVARRLQIQLHVEWSMLIGRARPLPLHVRLTVFPLRTAEQKLV